MFYINQLLDMVIELWDKLPVTMTVALDLILIILLVMVVI